MHKPTRLPRLSAALPVAASVLLHCASAAGGEEAGPYQELWKQHFWKKTPNLVLDDMELIEMSLFRAVPGIRPMTAALASALIKTCSFDALSGQVRLEQMIARAEKLKGGVLSAPEREGIAQLHATLCDEYLKQHPDMQGGGIKLDVTFGMGDVRRLERSASGCGTPEEVAERIRRLHGYDLILEHSPAASLASIRKAIDSGTPVILRTADAWHVAFGYAGNKLAYNEPLRTPVMKTARRRSHQRILKAIRETDSEKLRAVLLRGIRLDRAMGTKVKIDFETRFDIIIPDNGSIIIKPIEEGRFDAWFVHSGERSARGLDKDILEALDIAKRPEFIPPETGDLSQDLWNRHFFRKMDLVLGHSKLVEGICVRSDGSVRGIHAALASVICTTDGLGPTTCAIKPGLFFYNARKRYLGDEVAELMDEEVEALTKLGNLALKKFSRRVKGQGAGKWPFWDAARNIHETCGSKATLNEALSGIARWHGWDADVEGGRPVSYEKYQAALHKEIPILLADNVNKRALVCYGYVDEGDKHYLLICDPLSLRKPEIRLSRDNFLPSYGFRFEEFSRDRYVPFFIHNWKDSLKAWDKEIGEIMKKREATP